MIANIDPIQPGDAASPNLWNSRFASLTTVINGNIDSDNLKNGAVTREKIADRAINSAKLNIQKYVDANGWTVSDMGGLKTYSRVLTVDGNEKDNNGNPGAIGFLIQGNGARRDLGKFPAPVGRTTTNVNITTSYFGNYSGHLVTAGEIRDSDILIAGGNIWPHKLSFKGVVFVQATETV